MKLLVSCAEYSGDILGAEIVSILKTTMDVECIGVTGPELRNVGVESIERMEDLNRMGFFSVLGNLPNTLRIQRRLKRLIPTVQAVLCIDSSSFHLPLLKYAKQQKITSIGVSSPQIWAWRPKRAAQIEASMDALFCLFSFEPGLYKSTFPTHWYGHPIVDRFTKRSTIDAHLFGLLPGSRDQEISRHLPIFLETARLIKLHLPQAHFLCSTPRPLSSLPNYVTWQPGGSKVMKTCRAVLSKSGTCTLELAIQQVPMVVAHQIHPFTYFCLQPFLKVEHIALPNILSRKTVVPEFIQVLSPIALAEAMLTCSSQEVDLAAVGNSGAAQRIACEIQRILHA